MAATPHRWESHAPAIHRPISTAVPEPEAASKAVQVPEANSAPAGSTVRDTAFQPGDRLRVTVVEAAPPATAVRVAVDVAVDVGVAVGVAVEVRVAVAVAVGMAVGQAGAVVATAPTVVGVAVRDALVKVTRRLRTTMPPGRFGDVIATSITAVPDVEEVRTAKLARPPEVVVPQAGLVRIAEVPVDVTAYVAPDSGAFVQSAAVTVIAVSMPDWRVTGTGVATIAGALAEGLIPKVIPLASRSSSESSGPT